MSSRSVAIDTGFTLKYIVTRYYCVRSASRILLISILMCGENCNFPDSLAGRGVPGGFDPPLKPRLPSQLRRCRVTNEEVPQTRLYARKNASPRKSLDR